MAKKSKQDDHSSDLRTEVNRLNARIAALEAALTAARQQPADSPPKPTGLSEETILVIGAAVAAFLGKRPHIRQIRLLGSAAWAQQGRVTIQASHVLAHSDRRTD